MIKETILPGIEVALGDSMDCVDHVGTFDSMITDPPYGLKDAIGSKTRANEGHARAKEKTVYDVYEDTEDNLIRSVIPIIEAYLSISRRAVMTCGIKTMFKFPQPKHIGSLQYNYSNMLSSWGPMLWQPLLYYGKDPFPQTMTPDSLINCTPSRDRTIKHPCPKPIKDWTRLVERASKKGDRVVDPFMGSGTTGVCLLYTSPSPRD